MVACPLNTGFCAKAEFKTVPVLSWAINGLQSQYLDRNDPKNADSQIQGLIKRQNDCEMGMDWNPITIFPEGSTTNGTHLVKFKRGAFKAMRTVKPCYLEISKRFFAMNWECLPFGYFLVLFVCSMCIWTSKVHMMPEFTPTKKMLTMHAEKGSEDWEVYAECVREAMSKYSGLPCTNQPLRLKVKYEDFMVGDKPTMQVDDKLFSWDKDGNGIVETVKDEEKHPGKADLQSKSSKGSKKTKGSSNAPDSGDENENDSKSPEKHESCEVAGNNESSLKPNDGPHEVIAPERIQSEVPDESSVVSPEKKEWMDMN